MWVESERFEILDEAGKRHHVIKLVNVATSRDLSDPVAAMHFLIDGTDVTAFADGTFMIEKPRRLARRITPANDDT